MNYHTVLTLCMLGNFSFFCCRLLFSKISFRNTIKVSNSLDPDRDGHLVSPDLGPKLSARSYKQSVKLTPARKEFSKI